MGRGILFQDKDKFSKCIGQSLGNGYAVLMCWSERQIATKRALWVIGKLRQICAIMNSLHASALGEDAAAEGAIAHD
jgi:hypothetical protein